MQWRNRAGIRSAILFWISTLSLIPLAIVAYQGYHCARQALVETQHAHMASMLDARRTRLETMLKVVQSDLHLLSVLSAGHPDQTGGTACNHPGCLCSVDPLKRAMENKPYYDMLTAFSPDWRPLLFPSQPISGETIPESFRQEVAASSGLVFSHLVMTEAARPTILTGCPLMPATDNASPPGYIVGRLDLSSVLIPVLSDRNGLGTQGHAMLLTPDGTVLSYDSGSLVSRKAPQPLVQVLSSNTVRSVPVLVSHDGRTWLTMAATVQPTGWRLLVMVDRDEAFHWLRVLAIRALITGSLTFLLVLLIGFRISRSLSRPLQELAATANRIGHGDLSQRVPALSGREASEVGAAFNRMMDNLERLQQQLAHQASLAAIGELSSSVVHEMRNPLSSVKINLQGLARFAAQHSDHSEYVELAEIALSQVARLERMLNELLQYGRPIQLTPAPLPVRVLLDRCIADLAGAADRHEVALTVDCPADCPAVRGDLELLTRAVENLLLNAIEASPSKSTVHITVQPDTTSGSVRIRIADEGTGIPGGILPELFRPFVSSKPEGTGLGLANVKKIVEAHGGTVSGENSDTGAVFTMTLPIAGEPNGTHADH